MSPKYCPDCKGPLEVVRQGPNSMLNADQFDSVKAGDYFCRTCKSDKAGTGYRYFWEADLKAAPASPPVSPAPRGVAPLSVDDARSQARARGDIDYPLEAPRGEEGDPSPGTARDAKTRLREQLLPCPIPWCQGKARTPLGNRDFVACSECGIWKDKETWQKPRTTTPAAKKGERS